MDRLDAFCTGLLVVRQGLEVMLQLLGQPPLGLRQSLLDELLPPAEVLDVGLEGDQGVG